MLQRITCSNFGAPYKHYMTEFIAHAQVNPICWLCQLTCPAQATYLFIWATLFIKQTRTYHNISQIHLYIHIIQNVGQHWRWRWRWRSVNFGGAGIKSKQTKAEQNAENRFDEHLHWQIAEIIVACHSFPVGTLLSTPFSWPVALHTHSFNHHWVNQSIHTHCLSAAHSHLISHSDSDRDSQL